MTEQRGRVKEENLVQRMRKKLLEEERMRNPLAQGLPWTTDEPENTMKPRAKEPTELFDVVLHSELHAFGRARFDHQVAERNSLFDKLEMERERQRKLDEEIEIKQLRKEQAPRAHPMPDFSRPFVPKRSVKPQTVPREPRFQPRAQFQGIITCVQNISHHCNHADICCLANALAVPATFFSDIFLKKLLHQTYLCLTTWRLM